MGFYRFLKLIPIWFVKIFWILYVKSVWIPTYLETMYLCTYLQRDLWIFVVIKNLNGLYIVLFFQRFQVISNAKNCWFWYDIVYGWPLSLIAPVIETKKWQTSHYPLITNVILTKNNLYFLHNMYYVDICCLLYSSIVHTEDIA